HHHFTIPGSAIQKRVLNETVCHSDVREIILADENEGASATFSFEQPVEIWRCPVESVSLSEGGFERVFQSIALLFRWELSVGAQSQWEQSFECRLTG
ncbi:DUF1926 domain-containing protein, partial [bacterium]|nr:DUF1926 domain-containing protein [bacterium]